DEYDLIVANPPFYTEDPSTGSEKRDKARFTESLPFEDLAEAAGLLLSDEGIFCVILPFKEEEKFIALANENEIYPFKITRVKGTPATEIKRSLIAFSRDEVATPETDELVIETDRHSYTPEYISLTKDFYLKM
ncbi:MAG: tRNA (adenine-N(6)-)-methyltransferase, partial [Flavobacterium sp.]